MGLNLNLHEEGVNVTDQAQYCARYGPCKAGLYLDILVQAKDAVLEFPALKSLSILHPKLPSLKNWLRRRCPEKTSCAARECFLGRRRLG
jgi:hypothetical protein